MKLVTDYKSLASMINQIKSKSGVVHWAALSIYLKVDDEVFENGIKTNCKLCRGTVSYLYGGWSVLLGALLLVVVVDYISGIAVRVEGGLSSKVGYKGMTKKVFIYAMVSMRG